MPRPTSYAVFCLKNTRRSLAYVSVFFFLCFCYLRDLRSFPTRRSSDLQKELTKMQLDNQKEIAEMQNETQKEIAGIQSATSRQNTKDQVYAQNEMLAISF